jgi:hypothetical protein
MKLKQSAPYAFLIAYLIVVAYFGIQIGQKYTTAAPDGTQTAALPVSKGGTGSILGLAPNTKTIAAQGVDAGTGENKRKLWMISEDNWGSDQCTYCFPAGSQPGDVVIMSAASGWMKNLVLTNTTPGSLSAYGWTNTHALTTAGDEFYRYSYTNGVKSQYLIIDQSNTHW